MLREKSGHSLSKRKEVILRACLFLPPRLLGLTRPSFPCLPPPGLPFPRPAPAGCVDYCAYVANGAAGSSARAAHAGVPGRGGCGAADEGLGWGSGRA